MKYAAVLLAVLLSGCAAQLLSSSERTVVVKARIIFSLLIGGSPRDWQ